MEDLTEKVIADQLLTIHQKALEILNEYPCEDPFNEKLKALVLRIELIKDKDCNYLLSKHVENVL